MRIDRYTQKMQEALQSAQDLAAKSQSPEIGNEHFLLALLDQGEGVTRPLLEKLGYQPTLCTPDLRAIWRAGRK
jgi:ATP-dependent Clp protease ATP-binding subunit ClpB